MKNKVIVVNEGIEKNIAIISNMGDDLIPPLKMKRDPSLRIEDEEPPQMNSQKIIRRKAEVVDYISLEEEKEKREEKIPWNLEDSEQRAFIGRKMQMAASEEETSTYYAMIKEKNEIKFYKIQNWYKFTPKLQYVTLTLEEAEEKMQKKYKETGTDTLKRDDDFKEDEIEYKEVFDDDDEEEIQQEKQKKERKKRLDSSGKDMKKLVKSYEKPSEEEESGEEKEEAEQDITELDIKMYLYSGPISVKNLVEKFKKKIKLFPKSKEVLRNLIKKICNIKVDSKTGEKLLILKEVEKEK
ncbi:hypothetical protein NEFER03_0388 [Nematocida sp. LUAm3]|nr:hypothetical protein NEFER03_0388 [Nematocida sp. LUAm3]KAI5175996.1 hypothetical protein NEFER02_1842 [Nematocida sp. LUAm2]KAI5179092.1 hypothetical protein NEFER01_1959 [Nematocida sp. LUAm1]